MTRRNTAGVCKLSTKLLHPPGFMEILDAQKKEIFASLNCVQIGKIESFDAATQTASISLLLKRVVNIDPKGVKTLQENITIIYKCPVMSLFGGNAFLSMPIAAGDNCLVLFNDRQIDDWFVNGGVQIPTSSRMHDVSDAFAIVGIRALTDIIATYLSNGIRLSYGDNGTCQIDLQEAAINTLAEIFTHTGNMNITGNLEVGGDVTCDADLIVVGDMSGNGGTVNCTDSLVAAQLHASNGATGSYTIVNVVNGIVISGS